MRQTLLEWYAVNGASFSWRRPEASDYERICVEVLLQRTRRETVSAIYMEFFSRFPTWESIADCPEDELGQFLKPLGLWRRRAVSLKALASYASSKGGHFPSTAARLKEVPAVGQYVGNAILLFQHHQARPLVDVNMARVIERLLRPRKLADIRHDPWLQSAASWLVRKRPIETNWATLDFASSVCRSNNPKCSGCILRRRCTFATSKRQLA
ncbi:hypothetical protein PXK30_22825 [Phaeobacter gallaeciensis]|nr:hypothetical protein [Phaeobacter gallaeciensis]MDE4306458.1 hypothetical protein [Phaeobacter gallaeciensis]MDE4310923.1 hypothetical protein [Phaeobacter gallaeciensis]MDE4315384.1 hypothetical protein [Phaeobacter gallaeciensis]MDE4319850.1 hypothetical protein [Phaeobacter gallaeciensis]MDE4324311.1 hypothetical protein [Phaeobacter gallaeciensis]